MTTNRDKSNRPAWIGNLCEAMAQAFEDESLPTDAHNLLADAMEGVVNLYPVKRDANEARTLLPIALERAINSTEDEDNEDGDDELSDEEAKYTGAISAIITDPRTPEYIASPLMTIMNNILNGEDGAVSRSRHDEKETTGEKEVGKEGTDPQAFNEAQDRAAPLCDAKDRRRVRNSLQLRRALHLV